VASPTETYCSLCLLACLALSQDVGEVLFGQSALNLAGSRRAYLFRRYLSELREGNTKRVDFFIGLGKM
jgi:hypothetical protein